MTLDYFLVERKKDQKPWFDIYISR